MSRLWARGGGLLSLLLLAPAAAIGQYSEETCSERAVAFSASSDTESTLVILSSLEISTVRISIDLNLDSVSSPRIDVTSPAGTEVRILGAICCDLATVAATFADEGALPSVVGYACNCLLRPEGSLASFSGESSDGIWAIGVASGAILGTGTLDEWCVEITGCDMAPPLFLLCTASGDSVTLEWPLSDAYDSIEVVANGTQIAELAAGTTTWEHSDLDPGFYRYRVSGRSPTLDCGSVSSECSLAIGIEEACGTSPLEILVIPASAEVEILEPRWVAAVELGIDLTQAFLSPLAMELASPSGTSVSLLEQSLGSGPDLNLVFSDAGARHGSVTTICGCAMRPLGELLNIRHEPAAGDWVLTASQDGSTYGLLNEWCLRVARCDVPAPADLRCLAVGSSVELRWQNAADYDSVDVHWNGVTLGSLAGTSESFTHAKPANYHGTYEVHGSLRSSGCGTPSLPCRLYYFDGFEEYNSGSTLVPQGGWRDWNRPAWGPALVTDLAARSGEQSLSVNAASQVVYVPSGEPVDGTWVVSTWVLVPRGTVRAASFQLLSVYGPSAADNWSTRVDFDATEGTAVSLGGTDIDMLASLPIVLGEWIELRVVIDLRENTQEIHYGDSRLATGAWSVSGATEIAAIAILGDGASPQVFFDDLALFSDCDRSGVNDVIELTTGESADCDSNGVPDACDVASPSHARQLVSAAVPEGGALGTAVATTHDVAIAGAPYDESGSASAGIAVLYRRAAESGSWRETQVLRARAASGGDEFGAAVAIGGEWAFVGAPGHDASASNAGAVIAFRFDETRDEWQEWGTIGASDAAAQDRFGTSLALERGTLLVGAPLDNGLDANSGSAYLFRFDGEAWIETQKLTASDAAAFDEFGAAVVLRDCIVVIGARRNDDAGPSSGSAYVFIASDYGEDWTEHSKLTATDGSEGDEFGASVATNGEFVLVGAPEEDSEGTDAGAV